MQPLYKISADYLAAYDDLNALEGMPPEVIRDTLEGLLGGVEDKAVNVAAYIKNLEADAISIKLAEQSMSERREKIELKINNLRNYLLFYLQQCNIIKISSSAMFEIKVKSNPPSVVIENENEIPQEFKNIEVVEKVDKMAIKTAIKNGVIVPGAHIEQNKTLIIK